jgi:outer membrane protein insertion porin family
VCLLAALLALVPAESPAQPPSGGHLPEQLQEIAGVRFQGLSWLGRRELRAANLKTRKPSFWPWRDRPALRLDYLRADTAAIAAFYRHRGYLDARAHWVLEPTRDPSAGRVVFVIEKGRRSRVGSVTLTGVQAFHERELRRDLLAKPGRIYDPSFLGIDTLTLSRLYQERGYRPHTLAAADRPAATPLAVAVRYDVREGPRYTIGRIDVESSGRLREQLARRELLVRPGDVFRRSRLEESVERLYDTGLFNQVQVSSFTDTASSALDLLVRVNERRSRWVDLGVGSGSTDLFRVSGAWGHRNLDQKALLGSLVGDLALDRQRRDAQSEAQVLRVRQGRASANLVEPWLLGVRLRGQASAFYEEARDDRDSRFLQRRDSRGVELGVLREFSRIFRGSLTGHSALVHQSYDIFLSTADSTRDSLSRVLQRYWDNGIALSLFRDTRDDRITPTRGSIQTLVGETAGGPLRGASSYQKVQFVSSWYAPQRNGWLLAVRGSGGAMGPLGDADNAFAPGEQDDRLARVPKERRLFLGGVNSLRGWGENSIPGDGGLALLLANLELRIPLWGPFGAEVFLDAGNVWTRPEHVRIADFVAPWSSRQGGAGDLRYSYGAGARLLLPFGPLRLDLAWSRHPEFPGSEDVGPLRNFAYQFAIGPSF